MAATTCECGADLWLGGSARRAAPVARSVAAAHARPRQGPGAHPWAAAAWTIACVLGWIANRIFLATDSYVGSGFGNLGYEILCGLVGVAVGMLGLILAVFRPTRRLGSLVGAAGAGFVAGLVLGFAMAMVSMS